MNKIKLDFKKFFASLDGLSYVVIKLDPSFPNYLPGQDIDILCREHEELAKRVIAYLSIFIDDKYSINVEKKIDHIHIDLLDGSVVHFRFDLLGSLPKYKQVNVKSSLFDVLIESSIEKVISDYIVKVPNTVDEAVFRYIEFLEYISLRPDKVKHCSWILDKISSNPSLNEKFFSRFHHFISLPSCDYPKKSYYQKIKEHIVFSKDIAFQSYYFIKRKGIGRFIFKVKAIFFK